jgi:hypothetical protein
VRGVKECERFTVFVDGSVAALSLCSIIPTQRWTEGSDSEDDSHGRTLDEDADHPALQHGVWAGAVAATSSGAVATPALPSTGPVLSSTLSVSTMSSSSGFASPLTSPRGAASTESAAPDSPSKSALIAPLRPNRPAEGSLLSVDALQIEQLKSHFRDPETGRFDLALELSQFVEAFASVLSGKSRKELKQMSGGRVLLRQELFHYSATFSQCASCLACMFLMACQSAL